jgi:hypothetical protein
MIQIINQQCRSKLGEGRSYQMGFAFLKKVKDETFETIQPISPCKDYLNDVIFAEHTNKPISAFGCKLSGKQDIFDKEFGYMAISICKYKYPSNYDTNKYPIDVKRLKDNREKLESFINQIEEYFNLDWFNNTTIVEVSDNLYFIEVPIIWTKSTYMISLYSLLLRVGQFYEDTTIDPIEWLEKFNAFLDDVSLVKQALPKLKNILKYGPLPQDFSNLRGDTSTHNLGIIAYKLDYSQLINNNNVNSKEVQTA